MSYYSDVFEMYESYCSDHANKASKRVVPNAREAHRAVAMFLCYVGLPPKSVEQIYFKEFVSELNPNLYIRAFVIEQHYLEIYEEFKSKIKDFFTNFDGQISLTIDMIDYEYMCLTAHFIDEDWKLKNWVIHYRSVGVTGVDCLAEAVFKCLSELDIVSKISTLTMKACNYDEKVFDTVKDRIQEKKKLQLNGRLFNVICCADVFSSMVQIAFEKIDKIILKLRVLVFWGRSLPVWDVTLGRLEEALKLEAMGEYLKNDDYADYEIPSAKEWKKVRGVYKLVQSIYEAAYVMFETKHSTANVHLHLLRELQATLTRESTSSHRFVRNLAKEMLKEFNKYWKDMFLVLAIATVLDPRFKMKYIEFSSSNYKANDNKSQAAMVLIAIHSLYEDYVIHNPEEEEKFVSDSSSSDSEDESPSPRHAEEQSCKFYDNFTLFQEYCQLMQSTDQPIKSELDRYLEEPVLPWRHDFSALSWWRAASSKYPTLSRMARDILAIPLSITTSFRAYYTQPRDADPRIKYMRPDLMNALMCTQSLMQGC